MWTTIYKPFYTEMTRADGTSATYTSYYAVRVWVAKN